MVIESERSVPWQMDWMLYAERGESVKCLLVII